MRGWDGAVELNDSSRRRWNMPAGDEEVRIRKMTEADLPKVKEIDREVVGPERALSWPLRVEAHWWVYRGMPNFVAEAGSELVGFVMGDIRGTEYGTDVSGWIDMIGVLPRSQGRGIGRRLVGAFCRECEVQGVRARVVFMETDKRLAGFWSSLGFRKGNILSYELKLRGQCADTASSMPKRLELTKGNLSRLAAGAPSPERGARAQEGTG
jgi:ribosomal protein S18 acetylase RimI-like enzyme